MYYSTIMYIYYITRYYTKISLSTLYYTVYCKNTKYIVYPRLFRCSCLLLSIWLTLQYKQSFRVVLLSLKSLLGAKELRTAINTQSLCGHCLQVLGEIARNFTLSFLFFNQKMRDQANGILLKGRWKIFRFQKKICSLTLESKFFCLFWIECNISHHRPKQIQYILFRNINCRSYNQFNRKQI